MRTRCAQLLDWMVEEPHDDLKFVVTSVPFVAEFDEGATRSDTGRSPGGTTRRATQAQRRNRENDKWSAQQFARQRDRDHRTHRNDEIEQLVFLTGDMHCCYHATMRIGAGSKYESITIHELAGGPVNQLQLANSTSSNAQHGAPGSEGRHCC